MGWGVETIPIFMTQPRKLHGVTSTTFCLWRRSQGPLESWKEKKSHASSFFFLFLAVPCVACGILVP